MRRNKKNRRDNRAFALGLCVSMALTSTAWAGPEFAYSGEKWERLRDNVMEYEELADLIHEYNPVVINSRLEYDEYRGKSHEDLKRAYEKEADGLYSSSDKMEESAEEGAPGYDSAMATAALARIQAEEKLDMADAQNEDSYVKKMEYDRLEASLVQQAQTKMNTYWQKEKGSSALREAVLTAKGDYGAVALKVEEGMATQGELLSAREKAESAQAEAEANEKEMDTLKRELCVMTGWSYDAQPEMGEIPLPSQEEIDSILLEEDKKVAIERNYVQKANEQRLKNTGQGSRYDVLEKKVTSGRQQIASDVEDKYKLLKEAQSDYALTDGKYQLALQNQQSASLRYELGTISRNEFLGSRGSLKGTQSARDVAALKLVQAMENYRWSVNGLAQTEGS